MVTAYPVEDEILESSHCQFLALAFELVNFDKNYCDTDFVEALKCSFYKISVARCDYVKLMANTNKY